MSNHHIVSRAGWGARYARGFRPAPLPARELYLHHSVTSPGHNNAAAVRTLENIGQSRFGGGISYTFAVTPDGSIYEGHGVDRQGAHTGGRNSIARAICLIGNYDVTRPPEAMLDAVAWLVAHGHREGWWPAQLTGGHRDAPGAATACPGRHAYALIPEINRRAVNRPVNPDTPAKNTNRQEHTMKANKLYRGRNRGRIICPVGDGTSALYGRAWVSVTGEGGGMIHHVLFQRNAADDGPPPGAGAAWSGRIRNASRVHKQLPEHTEYIEYDITVHGVNDKDGDPIGDADDPIGEVNVEFEAWKR